MLESPFIVAFGIILAVGVLAWLFSIRGFEIMKHKSLGLVMIGLFALTFASPGSAREGNDARWDFTVYLNDKKVGRHTFEVTAQEGETRVRSEANFKYRILLIPAYRYEHSNAERWADNCLIDMEARTNANGDRIQVSGAQNGRGFLVDNGDSSVELPDCVMTFAYWNPDFLQQQQLLNPQTGEYVDVSVEEVGVESLEVRGELVPATRYRLTAYEVDVTLWYSAEDEWLALESIAKGGHIIRYELS